MAEGSSGTDRQAGLLFTQQQHSLPSTYSIGLSLPHDYCCGWCEVFRRVLCITTLFEIAEVQMGCNRTHCARVFEL